METANHGQKLVTTAVEKLLGANEKRTAILIKNNGAVVLYIGSKPTDKIANMMPIAAAGTYTNEHNQGEIYVAAASDTIDLRFEEDACE